MIDGWLLLDAAGNIKITQLSHSETILKDFIKQVQKNTYNIKSFLFNPFFLKNLSKLSNEIVHTITFQGAIRQQGQLLRKLIKNSFINQPLVVAFDTVDNDMR